MIEYLGSIFGTAATLIDYLTYEEKTKYVDTNWFVKSGTQAALKQCGYDVRLSLISKVPSRELDGWEIVYELDKLARIRYRLEVSGYTESDRSVFMSKKSER